MMIPRHKNTRFHQKFPVKTVTTSTYMKTCNFDMKKQYQKCKGKSSPNIPCLTGREAVIGISRSKGLFRGWFDLIIMKRKQHRLHYFVVDVSNKFSTCSICGTKKIRKIIGWDTKDRGDMNQWVNRSVHQNLKHYSIN